MTVRTFGDAGLRHLHSAFDESVDARSACAGSDRLAAGYTEWQGRSVPALSVGWDWVQSHSGLDLIPRTVRCNLMLVDAFGNDLGLDGSSHEVETWLHCWNWQREVLDALRRR